MCPETASVHHSPKAMPEEIDIDGMNKEKTESGDGCRIAVRRRKGAAASPPMPCWPPPRGHCPADGTLAEGPRKVRSNIAACWQPLAVGVGSDILQTASQTNVGTVTWQLRFCRKPSAETAAVYDRR
jgi:hypothetical protein